MPLAPRSFAAIAAVAVLATPLVLRAQAEAQPAATAFDRLKALAGDWIDLDGAFGMKGKVRRWLAHWDDVLAYCEAPRHAGGGGAVLVLLRGT